MTTNNTTKKHTKSFFILALICLLCFTLSLFFACGNSDTADKTDSEKSYSRYEKDEGEIKNATFNFGTYGLKTDAYPQTNPTGWSRSSDNVTGSEKNSVVTSGIVDTDKWNDILTKLFKEENFKKFVAQKYDLDFDAIKETNSFDDDALAKHVIETYLSASGSQFANPGKYDNSVEDSKLFMLNNYRTPSGYQLGSAQKVTSSSKVTLEKGKVGVISIWVKTAGLIGSNKSGANIRLSNTFNGVTQNPIVVYGINNTDWQEYKLYVRADKNIETTITLEFGLGIGNGLDCSNFTEGTAYFDGISFETIDALPSVATEVMNYSNTSNSPIYIDGSSATAFAYDMDLDSALTTNTTGYVNSSIADKTITVAGNAQETIESSLFTVNPQEYVYVSFKLTNNLNKYGVKDVVLYANDLKAGDTNGLETVRTSLFTYSDLDEEGKVYGIMFKNNFKDGNARTFNLLVKIGSENYTGQDSSKYANGEVTLTDFIVTTGSISKFEADGITETENYNYYNLFSSLAANTISLHAGEKDFAEDKTDTYHLSVSPEDLGALPFRPTNVKGYKGVDSNHVYVKENGTNYEVNTNTDSGLINTKYLTDVADPNKYDPEIKTKLNYTGDKSIQPIMINNKTAGNYGFISDKQTISASAFARISIKVRVTDDAKAYVYLVDLDDNVKDVVDIEFTTNTNGYAYINDGQAHSEKLQFTEITSADMKADGWLTVNFYIATGASAKNFRIELWNGSRDGATSSQGYVFFAFDSFKEDETFSSMATSGAFTEVADWTGIFTTSNSVLYGTTNDQLESYYLHQRELDSVEVKYNSEQTEDSNKKSYDAKVVWAKTNDKIYAIYNTIDPVAVDPYASTEEGEEAVAESGCNAQSNPASFWMGFSSIVLAAVIVMALIMLIVKNYRRRKANGKKDAKSHYVVKSRYSKKADSKKQKQAKEEVYDEDDEDEIVDEPATEESVVENVEAEEISEEEVTEENNEQTLDEYVYGDVQDFGEMETNQAESTETEDSNVVSEESNDEEDSNN